MTTMRNAIALLCFLLSVATIEVHSQSSGISKNGKYVWADSRKTLDDDDHTLVIQAVKGGWKKEFRRGMKAEFSADDRSVLFLWHDSLYILELGGNRLRTIGKWADYRQAADGGWLICRDGSYPGEALLYQLQTGRTRHFGGVQNYWFGAGGNGIVMRTADGGGMTRLVSLDLRYNNELVVIWEGRDAMAQETMDRHGVKFAFITEHVEGGDTTRAVYCYTMGSARAELLTDGRGLSLSGSLGLRNRRIANGELRFSPRLSKLFIRLEEASLPAPDPSLPSMDLWSYTDGKVQSLQLKNLVRRQFLAAIDLKNRTILPLESDNELLLGKHQSGIMSDFTAYLMQADDDHALIAQWKDDVLPYGNALGIHDVVDGYISDEYGWNKLSAYSVYLVSLSDGSRQVIRKDVVPRNIGSPLYHLSPGGRYVVYYYSPDQQYYSYDIVTGRTVNLTEGTAMSFASLNPEKVGKYYAPAYYDVRWMSEDKYVLLWDHYGDIWRFDPAGTTAPVLLTNGFARRHNLDLLLIPDNNHIMMSENNEALDAATPTVVISISKFTDYRSNGYYELSLDKAAELKPLIPQGGNLYITRFEKAKNAGVYVIEGQCDTVPYHTRVTGDFKHFTTITSSEPETRKPVRQELMKYKLPDGRMGTAAVLYPDHFDSTKKYPVIFIYYEKDNSMRRFFKAYGEGYYVDEGYILCNPDIYYTIGETGQNALDAVVSAAESLSLRPYIDRQHMAIMGGSFSGFETNYIVTHTNLFAAAITGCGISDLISEYGSNEADDQSKLHAGDIEIGQQRLGVTPWERPDLFIRNSPIFYVDRVQTPILIFHSKEDERLPFAQGVEFFKALRRLGKRAWLIQVDGYGHCGCSANMSVGKDYWFNQFLAHYLKGAPAPKWMLDPIPARLKATSKLPFTLDSTGRTPGPGLLMDKEMKTPQQLRLLEHRTRVTDSGYIEAVKE